MDSVCLNARVRSLVFPLLLAVAFAGFACSEATLKTPAAATPGGSSDDTGSGDDGGSSDSPDASVGGEAGATALDTVVPTSAVQIIVEPSDTGAALVNAIKSAKTSVHMTMYLLSADTIINALIAQHSAGVDVKVVLNKSFPDGSNQNDVFTKLDNAGVPVKWAQNNLNYTHAKTVVIDSKTAWIMTMNATYGALRDNREYLAVDTDAKHVAQVEGLFELDFGGASNVSGGELVVSPSTSQTMLVELIDSATKTVDVEVESISDDKIVAALGRAHDRGARVRVIIADTTDSVTEVAAHSTMQNKGISLVRVTKPYIHAKAIVADGTVAFVGSENFTTNSLLANREIGVIFDVASEVSKVASTIDGDFALGK